MRRFLILLLVVLSFVSVPIGKSTATTSNSIETPANSEAPTQRRRYRRSSGNRERVRASTTPVGATARCRDGTYSFSQHRRVLVHGTAAWPNGFD
jgi:hypothetical protein